MAKAEENKEQKEIVLFVERIEEIIKNLDSAEKEKILNVLACAALVFSL